MRGAFVWALAGMVFGQACGRSVQDGTGEPANAGGSGTAGAADGSASGGLGGSKDGGFGGSKDGGLGGSKDGGLGGSKDGGLDGSEGGWLGASGGCALDGSGDSGTVDAAPIPACACDHPASLEWYGTGSFIRVCRNTTCATVERPPLPFNEPGAYASSHVAFGENCAERVLVSVYTTKSGPLMYGIGTGVSWESTDSGDPIKDGDVYSFELLDKSGRSLYLDRKSATYQKRTVECDGGPGVCIDTTLTELQASVTGGG